MIKVSVLPRAVLTMTISASETLIRCLGPSEAYFWLSNQNSWKHFVVAAYSVGFGPDIVGRDRTDGTGFVTPKYAFPSLLMLWRPLGTTGMTQG